MSKEISILARCPHEIKEERINLADDRRTLQTRSALGSNQSVQILVNNDTDLILPQGGLLTMAQLTGFISGPFNIKSNSNTLTIKTNNTTVNLTLPPSTRLSTDAVVDLIRANTSSIHAENANGHLYLVNSEDMGSRARISVSGSAASALGFDFVRGASGRTLYPGWRVVKSASNGERVVQFNSQIKNNPIFKVSYSADPRRCLRCASSRIENDWAFDLSGQVFLIENEDLLHQAAVKIIFTEKGSNIYHPFYGTTLTQQIGNKAINSVANSINEDVRRALVKMQNLQRAQSRFQEVSFKEMLLSIDSVRTTQDPNNLTAFNVEVSLRNASNEPISLTVFFTLPQVTSLNVGNFQ
jgi:phage baseplate assembly protein W